jgi:hypothetical protein
LFTSQLTEATLKTQQSIANVEQHDASKPFGKRAPSPSRLTPHRSFWVTLSATAAFVTSGIVMAEPAKGTLVATGKIPATVNVKHAYLIKGPNSFGDKAVRLLILSDVDHGAHIKSCSTMSCATEKMESGMTVEFDAGPRLLYWFVANGQRVQASGVADPASITLTANTPQRLTGKWTHDATGQGGPKIAVEFDAPVLKEFSKAR